MTERLSLIDEGFAGLWVVITSLTLRGLHPALLYASKMSAKAGTWLDLTHEPWSRASSYR